MQLALALLSICAVAQGLAYPPMGVMPPPTPGTSLLALVPTPAPAPTLAQDFEEIYHFITFRPINQLIQRYLLNDAQFQAFVRIINSQDAFFVRMRFRSQPEIMRFYSWVRTQLMLSGGSLEMEESEELLSIFNRTPYWANTVSGWQGFVNEFLAYYPEHMIRAHIDMKLMQNGIFAQFWARLKALKPVYERVLADPAMQRLIAQMQTNGIDFNQIDAFIRTQFGWVNVATTTTTTTTPATTPATSPATTPATSPATSPAASPETTPATSPATTPATTTQQPPAAPAAAARR